MFTSAFQNEAGNWQRLKAVSKDVGDESWWIPPLEDALWSSSKPACSEQLAIYNHPQEESVFRPIQVKPNRRGEQEIKKKTSHSGRKPMSIKPMF